MVAGGSNHGGIRRRWLCMRAVWSVLCLGFHPLAVAQTTTVDPVPTETAPASTSDSTTPPAAQSAPAPTSPWSNPGLNVLRKAVGAVAPLAESLPVPTDPAAAIPSASPSTCCKAAFSPRGAACG
jgi:hypothetical protein